MLENGNFIKLNRSILKWGWYDDPITKAVFLHLLLNANWKESEYRGKKIGIGEVVYGRKKFAKELGLSEQNVRTAIKHLSETGEISTSKVTNKFTVIKIEKWTIYQGDSEKANQQTNQRLTNNQPTTNHIQEGKKGRREEREREARARKGAKARGRKKNVWLTDEEYSAIKNRFENATKLIDHVGYIIANAKRNYPDHDALLWKIAEEDSWPIRKRERERESARELSAEEKEKIRQQEKEYLQRV